MLEKLGDVKMLLMAFVGFAFRLAYYATLRNPWLVYPAELTHGMPSFYLNR
jgi:hypothetical protein